MLDSPLAKTSVPETGTKFVPGKDSKSEDAVDPDGNVVATWADLDDCTHFISCCLGTRGGGLKIPTSFPGGPYGILSANKLAELLIAKKWVEILANKIADETKALDIMTNKMEPGDLIAYTPGSTSPEAGDEA